MLAGSLARYAPGIDAQLFEQWFIQQNPRYTTRNEAVDTIGKEVLGIVSVSHPPLPEPRMMPCQLIRLYRM